MGVDWTGQLQSVRRFPGTTSKMTAAWVDCSPGENELSNSLGNVYSQTQSNLVILNLCQKQTKLTHCASC